MTKGLNTLSLSLVKVLRSLAVFLLAVSLLLSATGCQARAEKRTIEYYDLFDTITSLTLYGCSEEQTEQVRKELYELLLTFHQETDIYDTYPDVASFKALNDAAGRSPVKMSARQMEFLSFCQQAYEISDGKVNVMIGSLTSLWHEARDAGVLPEEEDLLAASDHVSMDALVLDEAASTARILDPLASLDVGALAKGYAGNLAMDYLASQGIENYLLSLGGNICVHGAPLGTGRDEFVVGIQDPAAADGSYSDTVKLSGGCVVTSGDYQRYIEVDGVRYHHIIDPDTLYPCTLHHSVTIICDDSAMADLLSTAVFLMDEASGRALAEKYNATVIYEGKQ